MNWDAAGAIAELLGAIAVFVSLVYLAIQVRQSAGINKASAFQAMIDGVTAHKNHMFGPQNAPLVLRGLRSYSDLSAEDRIQFDNLLTNFLNYFEASYHAASAQTLGDETMENWVWNLETKLFCYPGAVDWWETAQFIYPPQIRALVDRSIAAANGGSDYWGLLASPPEGPPDRGDEPT